MHPEHYAKGILTNDIEEVSKEIQVLRVLVSTRRSLNSMRMMVYSGSAKFGPVFPEDAELTNGGAAENPQDEMDSHLPSLE